MSAQSTAFLIVSNDKLSILQYHVWFLLGWAFVLCFVLLLFILTWKMKKKILWNESIDKFHRNEVNNNKNVREPHSDNRVYRRFYANNNRHEIQLFTGRWCLRWIMSFFYFFEKNDYHINVHCSRLHTRTLIEAYITSRMIHSTVWVLKRKTKRKTEKSRYKNNTHTHKCIEQQ